MLCHNGHLLRLCKQSFLVLCHNRALAGRRSANGIRVGKFSWISLRVCCPHYCLLDESASLSTLQLSHCVQIVGVSLLRDEHWYIASDEFRFKNQITVLLTRVHAHTLIDEAWWYVSHFTHIHTHSHTHTGSYWWWSLWTVQFSGSSKKESCVGRLG